MPSKSQLFGQADIWDLSDYFAGTGPNETSFKWYDPGLVLTSRPYPYIFTESTQTSPSALDNRILPAVQILENTQTAPSALSLEIRNVNQFYTMQTESTQTTPSSISLTIASILRSYTIPTENTQITPSPQTLTVVRTLIDYTIPNENTQVTPSVIGVTIT